MKNQEIFDRVCRHLATQGKRSIECKAGSSVCRYRGPNGLKCAVGILIPDGKVVDEEWDTGDIARIIIPGSEVDADYFMELLQKVHDEHNPIEWRPLLVQLAKDFKLDSSIVNKLDWLIAD